MSRKILLRRRKFHEKITHTALEILVFFVQEEVSVHLHPTTNER